MPTGRFSYRNQWVAPPENAYDFGPIPMFVEGELWTLNAERRMHHMVHRRSTRAWREAAGWTALTLKLPRMASLDVRAIPFQPTGTLADAGAHIGCVKAAIDGIVDAGLLPDDSPEYVRSITLEAPRRDRDEPEGVLLILSGRRQP